MELFSIKFETKGLGIFNNPYSCCRLYLLCPSGLQEDIGSIRVKKPMVVHKIYVQNASSLKYKTNFQPVF
jgi:hypothetical protein